MLCGAIIYVYLHNFISPMERNSRWTSIKVVSAIYIKIDETFPAM